MSRRKKLLGLLMAVGVSVSMGVTPVLAETTSILDEISEEELTDEETTEDYAEDTSYSMLRGTNLNLGNVKIQKVSNHEVTIFGSTQCHKKCAKVYLSLFLERKVNGSYGSYMTFEYTSINVTCLDRGLYILVPSGSYYRVRGYHAASNGGLKESTSTLTSGIMIK